MFRQSSPVLAKPKHLHCRVIKVLNSASYDELKTPSLRGPKGGGGGGENALTFFFQNCSSGAYLHLILYYFVYKSLNDHISSFCSLVE